MGVVVGLRGGLYTHSFVSLLRSGSETQKTYTEDRSVFFRREGHGTGFLGTCIIFQQNVEI